MRILIVDADADVRRLLITLLATDGHQAIAAESGVHAMELFTSSPDRIDVLVTDVNMPEMDGPALVREVKKIRPEVGVVLMSADTNVLTPADTVFLPKPLTPATLSACLRMAFRETQRNRASESGESIASPLL